MSRAAASPILSPMAVLPVKLIMSVCGAATSASADSGAEPTTRLTTPAEAGLRERLTILMTPSGSWGAGLMTTVFPMASAGPIFPMTLVIGTL